MEGNEKVGPALDTRRVSNCSNVLEVPYTGPVGKVNESARREQIKDLRVRPRTQGSADGKSGGAKESHQPTRVFVSLREP